MASNTGWINAISMPTHYFTMVDLDGERFRVEPIKGADAEGNQYAHLRSADDLNDVVRDGNGDAVRMLYKTTDPSGKVVDAHEYISDVSWRTDFGVSIQHPKGAGQFLDSLKQAAPDVNMIRVDFNAETLKSDALLASWKTFADTAADRGYGIIIQYSDGDMSGQEGGLANGDVGKTPSENAADVGRGWSEIMTWLEEPGQEKILGAVYGLELINEPMAYKNNADGGAVYADDIVSILDDYGTDWHDKVILVGGLNASAQFQHVRQDVIKDALAAKDLDLVWSMHLYPDWVMRGDLDFDGSAFDAAMRDRIGAIMGDDILLTEMNLPYADPDGDGVSGLFDPDTFQVTGSAYNAARMFEWFADNNIGVTPWAVAGRGSSFLLNGGSAGISVRMESLALMNNIWSLDETEATGADNATPVMAERHGAETGMATEYGLGFGTGDNDVVMGTEVRNMLYGGAGDDTLMAGDAGDYLFGQHGDDEIVGGTAHDTLFGGSGNDTLRGGEGNDWLEGGAGLNVLFGGDGDDTIIGGRGDLVTLGSGRDTLYVTPGPEGEGRPPILLGDYGPEDRIVFGFAGSKRFAPQDLTVSRDEAGNFIFTNGNKDMIMVIKADNDTVLAPENFTGAASVTESPDVTEGNVYNALAEEHFAAAAAPGDPGDPSDPVPDPSDEPFEPPFDPEIPPDDPVDPLPEVPLPPIEDNPELGENPDDTEIPVIPPTLEPVEPDPEPEDPVDPPVDPEVPVDPPVDPEEPVDPPADPEVPVDPPVDPEEPMDPEEPTDPVDPPTDPEPEEPPVVIDPVDPPVVTDPEPEVPVEPPVVEPPVVDPEPEEPVDPPVEPPVIPEEPDDENGEETSGTSDGNACFVATAAYGSPDHADVVGMRRFRDETLMRSWAGRAFVSFYWRVGPHMAARVRSNGMTGRAVRGLVSRIVKRVG